MLLPTYYVGLMTLAGTNALVCLGLAFLLAAGQLSLGHAAFLGGGAYASAILARDYGVPPPLAILLAVAACAALAYVIGRLTLRLRGHYLPLATLAWGIAAYVASWRPSKSPAALPACPTSRALRVLGMEFGTRAMGALAWAAVGWPTSPTAGSIAAAWAGPRAPSSPARPWPRPSAWTWPPPRSASSCCRPRWRRWRADCTPST